MLEALTSGFGQVIVPKMLVVSGDAAEVTLMLWLLVVGVNAQRWTEQAGS
jgi:hypothetical protein